MSTIAIHTARQRSERIRLPFEVYGLSFLFFICFSLVSLDRPPIVQQQPSHVSHLQSPVCIAGQDSSVTITMSFIGDLMCHVPQINNAKKADGSYDFNPSFKEITPFLSAADFTMGNLECTFAGSGKPYQGYPAFNAPDAYLSAIKNAGIDFVGTANNHSMDTGEEGLLRTIKKAREAGLQTTGTFLTQQDRDSIRIIDIKGVKVAILNYTYGTNGAYPDASRKYMLNVADSALVHDDVLRARATTADIVLVFYHWGIENKQEPVAKQDSMFHWAADAGADLVIGAHPHVLEPLQYFKTAPNAKLDSGVVAWSLGNFLSNQYWRYTDAGVILTLTLKKNFATGKVSFEQTQYLPTMVNRSTDNSIQQHVVIPAQWCEQDHLPAWITDGYKTKLCEGFSDTRLMMTKGSPKPQLTEVLFNGGIDSSRCDHHAINAPAIDLVSTGNNVVFLQFMIAPSGKVVHYGIWDERVVANDSTLEIRARKYASELRFDERPGCTDTIKKIVTLNFSSR